MDVKKSLVISILTILMLILSTGTASAQVMWGKTELKKGQIGKVTILNDVHTTKISGEKLIQDKKLKKGEEYRVYSYRVVNNSGYYGLGGGLFVQKSSKVKYETPSKAKLAQLERQLVDKQLIVVKNEKISGYKFYEAYPVYFTGREVPEIVVSRNGFEDKEQKYIDKSLLQVYQYDATQNKWSVINSFKKSGEVYSYRPLKYITKGKLLDNQKEQLVVGYVWGSDFALTPIVYGSLDGKNIEALINKEDAAFTGGDAVIKDHELFFVDHLSTVAERYVYKNGKFVSYKGKGEDDYKLAHGAQHILTLDRINGRPHLIGNRNITMKVGESFSIVRKDASDTSNKYIDRLYFNAFKDGVLEPSDGQLKAVKPGTFEMNVLMYDVQGPGLTIKITVVE